MIFEKQAGLAPSIVMWILCAKASHEVPSNADNYVKDAPAPDEWCREAGGVFST